MASRFRRRPTEVHGVGMAEILRTVLGGALVMSLAGISVYVLVFAAVVVHTARGARRPDPVTGEVDRLLEELGVGPHEVPPKPARP